MPFFIPLLCMLLLASADAPAQTRIVSLDLCTDWLLMRYADAAQVAAYSPVSRRFPAPGNVQNDETPHHAGDLESILAFAPDLVIGGQYSAPLLRARLQRLGVRVHTLPLPQTPADIPAHERRLLTLIGKAETVALPPPPAPEKTLRGRLLFLDPSGMAMGKGSFADGLLTWAGWTNYLDRDGFQWPDLERLAADPPDAVFWSTQEGKILGGALFAHPLATRLFLPTRRATGDYLHWQCAGPWTWAVAERLRALHTPRTPCGKGAYPCR